MKTFFILLLSFYSLNILSQEKPEEKKKVNLPIIFGELIFGGAGTVNGTGGFVYGGELNYQHNKDLFSIRYIENSQMENDVLMLAPILAFPILKQKHLTKETGLLYGKRWIYEGSSLSLSGGISLNSHLSNYTNENNEHSRTKEEYLGFPFEINFKWFKSKKKRFRIYYGIIPVGKPTSFGRNFGFKILGSISKNSFIGLGLTYGFGIHKKY